MEELLKKIDKEKENRFKKQWTKLDRGSKLDRLLKEIRNEKNKLNSKIPSIGDKIKYDKFIFTIMSVDNKRIKRVRIFKKTKS